ncbi:MAG: hypothetical protein HC895_17060 [Leptolyngbyaceae cyanobacterium SM1_3_5]|nr:hypothetical protein [Leptolyngbyaceae cyanobacterium SM1_3_5]
MARSSTVHFENRISEQSPAFLAEHQVSGQVIFPIAAFVEMAIAAGRDRVPTGAISLSDFKIQQPIVLSTNETPVQLVRTDDRVEIFSQKDGWNRHAIGTLNATDDRPDSIDLAAIRANCPRSIDPAIYYQEARSIGFDYGASFQMLRQIWQGDGQAIGEIHLSESSPYHFHPIALDAALQVVGAALPDADATYLPVGFDRFTLHRPPIDRLWSVVKLRTVSDRVIADLQICTETGERIATLDGLHLQKTNQQSNWQDWLYEVEWRSIDLPPQSEPTPLLIFGDRQGFGQAFAQATGGMLVDAPQRDRPLDPPLVGDFEDWLGSPSIGGGLGGSPSQIGANRLPVELGCGDRSGRLREFAASGAGGTFGLDAGDRDAGSRVDRG